MTSFKKSYYLDNKLLGYEFQKQITYILWKYTIFEIALHYV